MYQSSLNLHFGHLRAFLTCKNNLSTNVAKESFDSSNSNTFGYYGGGKALVFSSDELLTYASVDLHEQQYQFTWGSGPLLRMACTSPIGFNWFVDKITQ